MLELILIGSWLLIGALSGLAGSYWIDKEDLRVRDLVFFSCLGIITLIAFIMYGTEESLKARKFCGKLKKFWNKTLIRR